MAQTLLGNVKGPKGDTGAQGPQGEQGPTGAQGPQGETGPANTAFITDAFSTSQAYNAGDYCIYNNTLYRFAEDKAAGEWDDSKVMSTLIGTELSGLNSRLNLMSVFYYDSGMNPGDDACKNAILASPHDIRPNIIYVKNTGGQNECLYGSDLDTGYSAYILISWYRGVKLYREEVGGSFVIRDIASL